MTERIWKLRGDGLECRCVDIKPILSKIFNFRSHSELFKTCIKVRNGINIGYCRYLIAFSDIFQVTYEKLNAF